LAKGDYTLAATARNTWLQSSISKTQDFTIDPDSAQAGDLNTVVGNTYDGDGRLLTRVFASGETQNFTWDRLGRLIRIAQTKTGTTNRKEWNAIYDGFGRRLRTTYTEDENPGVTLTLDSWYDPQVEFLEIAVEVNGSRVWKVYGPDANGVYGGLQGIGGLEAVLEESTGSCKGALNDLQGNVIGAIYAGSVHWNSVHVLGYGAAPGTGKIQTLTSVGGVLEASVWRTRRMDPFGYFYMGARYYEPQSGRFISSDPMGHGASMDLYSYANGDPVNGLDPDGRCQKFDAYTQSIIDSIQNPQKLDPNTQAIIDSIQYPWLVDKVLGGPSGSGPGYSLRFYNIVTDNGKYADGWDLRFADQVSHGNNLYPFGNLSASEIEVAISRGYVSAGDRPVFYHEYPNGGGTMVGMNQDQLIMGVILEVVGPGLGELMAPATEALTSAAPELTVGRGLSKYGGVFTSTTNEAGGTIWTSAGTISQNDFAPIVNSALYKGDVDIITGVHGFRDGTILVDESLYHADVARFGNIEGVTVHNFPTLTPARVSELLSSPNTTIGGFCDSESVLSPFVKK
jgi:RHS repeat-associated protein